MPKGVVTETFPDDDPHATTAVIVVELVTAKDAAASPPKLTAVTAHKLVPVMVTVCPADAEVFANDVMVGAGVVVLKVKLV